MSQLSLLHQELAFAPRARNLPKPIKEAAQLTANSSEWYTPGAYVDPAHVVMGGIDCDPASCALANSIVHAERYYSLPTNGIFEVWGRRTWLNPPSPAGPWWCALVEKFLSGEVEQALFFLYNVDSIVNQQAWTPQLHAFSPGVSLCIPNHRVRFMLRASDAIANLEKRIADSGRTGEEADKERAALGRKVARLQVLHPDTLVKGDQPTHGSAIIGLGVDQEKFRAAYGAIGGCR